MRILFVLLILAWSVPSNAMHMIGFGAATCSSQTQDVEFASSNTYSNFPSTEQRGQSWTAGDNGVLYSVSVYRYSISYDATNITIRIGTSADLSGTCALGNTCQVEYTCAIADSVGWKECVIPEGSRPTLTSSTVYYFMMGITSGYGTWPISRDTQDGGRYANGTGYYQGMTSWNLAGDAQAYDYPFRTTMCD